MYVLVDDRMNLRLIDEDASQLQNSEATNSQAIKSGGKSDKKTAAGETVSDGETKKVKFGNVVTPQTTSDIHTKKSVKLQIRDDGDTTKTSADVRSKKAVKFGEASQVEVMEIDDDDDEEEEECLSAQPTIAWKKLKKTQHYEKVKPLDPNTPIKEDQVCCMV